MLSGAILTSAVFIQVFTGRRKLHYSPPLTKREGRDDALRASAEDAILATMLPSVRVVMMRVSEGLVSPFYNSVRNVMRKPLALSRIGKAIQLICGSFDNVQHTIYRVLGSLPCIHGITIFLNNLNDYLVAR